MKILGLNLNHADTSACIIVNGKIIAAIEEERFVTNLLSKIWGRKN